MNSYFVYPNNTLKQSWRFWRGMWLKPSEEQSNGTVSHTAWAFTLGAAQKQAIETFGRNSRDTLLCEPFNQEACKRKKNKGVACKLIMLISFRCYNRSGVNFACILLSPRGLTFGVTTETLRHLPNCHHRWGWRSGDALSGNRLSMFKALDIFFPLQI